MYNQALGVCRGLAFWVMGWLLSGYNLRMDVSAAEKSNYYSKYIRKMRLEMDDNGILKIKVQEE